MLYTRRGDDGTSGLFGTKERLGKDSVVFEALGTLDELNSQLGLCRALLFEKKIEGELQKDLITIQECLFIAQAELAGAEKHLTKASIDILEQATARAEARIENPHAFVIPGSTVLSAHFDIARTVARRAERTLVRAIIDTGVISAETKAYLNRLSSFLYAAARVFADKNESSPSY